MHSDQRRGPGERNRLHTPNLAGRPLAEAAEISGRGSAPPRPSVRGGPSPGRCDILAPRPGSPDAALVPRPPPRGSAEKAPSARLACIRPARPAPSLVPSHAPEPTGATTHSAPQGRGSSGRRRAEALQKARQLGSAAAEAVLQPLEPPLLTSGGEHQGSSSVGVGTSARCSTPRLLLNFTRFLRGKQPPPLSSPKTAVSDPDGAGGEGQEASGAESTMGGES